MQMRVSIDEHLFSVIEADSIPVRKTIPIHRLPIHGGERYSILMDTNNNKPGDSFYLRSIMVTDCINNAAPELNTTSGQTALAVLRVVSPDSTVKMSSDLSLPTTQDWNEAITGPCIDLDRNLLSPIKPTPLVGPVAGRVFFNTSLGTIIVPGSRNVTRNVVSKFFMNNITWIPSYERPILHDFLEGGNPDHINRSEIALGIMDHDGPWELIINNLDAALEHPIHLHGVDSCIVGSGAGVLTSSNAEQAKRNLNNPLCRDSFVVQGGGYLILRIQVLNPGAWFIHCHLGWHLASGFAGVVVMRPDAIRQFQLPPAHRQLCKDFINRDSFPSLDGSSYNSQAGSNGSEGISDNYHGSDHVQKTSSKVCRPTSKMYQR